MEQTDRLINRKREQTGSQRERGNKQAHKEKEGTDRTHNGREGTDRADEERNRQG